MFIYGKMGLIVPSIYIDRGGVESNLSLSDAYLAIADNAINFRNYANTYYPVTQCNGITTSNVYPDGVQIQIYYGIWESYQARTDSNFPVQILSTQTAYNSNLVGGSNLYQYAYSVLKETYSNSTDYV